MLRVKVSVQSVWNMRMSRWICVVTSMSPRIKNIELYREKWGKLLISIRIMRVSVQCTEELHLYFLVSYVLEFWISKYLVFSLVFLENWTACDYKIHSFYFFGHYLFLFLYIFDLVWLVCAPYYTHAAAKDRLSQMLIAYLCWILIESSYSHQTSCFLFNLSQNYPTTDKHCQLFFRVYHLNETIKYIYV